MADVAQTSASSGQFTVIGYGDNKNLYSIDIGTPINLGKNLTGAIGIGCLGQLGGISVPSVGAGLSWKF